MPALDRMADMGLTYEKDGALWFKSTDYGDEKDRVLRKSDGTFAYLTPISQTTSTRSSAATRCSWTSGGADHHPMLSVCRTR